MKLNEKVQVTGRSVRLIPYEQKHVEKYHQWMKNPQLQELTASEPLTLEEEYAMQRSWRVDEDKCTFLIVSKQKYEQSNDELEALIGDTNLFIHEEDCVKLAEVEIMIAEEEYRGKHLGWESMLLMLKYGQQEICIKKFIAKINKDNERSINMFTKIGFVKTSGPNIFHEITLERDITDAWVDWLNQQVDFKISPYTSQESEGSHKS